MYERKMATDPSFLSSLVAERETFIEETTKWAEINTHSFHHEGLALFLPLLEKTFSPLGEETNRISLPPWNTFDDRGIPCTKKMGEALLVRARQKARHRILFVGHMDTVYPQGHPFNYVERKGEDLLVGPGVTDMKGGLVVLYHALRLFESSPIASSIGWDLVITPDEELGSPSSTPLLQDLSQNVSLGLVFEPALSDGHLVSERKGSANFVLLAKGRSAHAGRDIDKGENALLPLLEAARHIHKLHNPQGGCTVNIGTLHGGSSPNVVPDHGSCRLNIRFATQKIGDHLENKMQTIAHEYGVSLHRETYRPPKPLDHETKRLLHAYASCSQEMGKTLHWRPTGGVCDGNTLAAAGIPTLDTLGVVGNNIHQEGEYLEISSLVQRTQITTLFLLRLADGSIAWPQRIR